MTDKLKVTCFLTKNGWEMSADSPESADVWQAPLRTQGSYLELLDALDAMKPRTQATAYFKLSLRFRPAKKGTQITVDYKLSAGCPAKYAECGLDLYNTLLEELQK